MLNRLDETSGPVLRREVEWRGAEASRKMAFKEIGRLPVVEVEGSLKVVGILTRSDIVNAYDRTVLQSEEPGA